MTDLGPLLAAVTDEWERGRDICQRAGIDPRTGGQKLGALERDGFVVSTRNFNPRNVGDRVMVYRRGPKAPPLILPPTAEQVLDGLRGKLDAIKLDNRVGKYGGGYMDCWDEVSLWLDAARRS